MIDNRPLSPHLSIHKKVLTSVFSISHRISGILLFIGSFFISVWLFLLALGPTYFYFFEFLKNTLFFKIILFFFTISIFYHLFNGIRYLFWTYGLGMDLKIVYSSGYAVVFMTIISAIFVWVI